MIAVSWMSISRACRQFRSEVSSAPCWRQKGTPFPGIADTGMGPMQQGWNCAGESPRDEQAWRP